MPTAGKCEANCIGRGQRPFSGRWACPFTLQAVTERTMIAIPSRSCEVAPVHSRPWLPFTSPTSKPLSTTGGNTVLRPMATRWLRRRGPWCGGRGENRSPISSFCRLHPHRPATELDFSAVGKFGEIGVTTLPVASHSQARCRVVRKPTHWSDLPFS